MLAVIFAAEMTKRIINIMLILVLSVTILPIKQVGNALFNNQWTEELNDHSEHQTEKNAHAKWAYIGNDDLLNGNPGLMIRQASRFYSFSQRLPVHPSCEIHYPPPDLLS